MRVKALGKYRMIKARAIFVDMGLKGEQSAWWCVFSLFAEWLWYLQRC